MRKISKPDYDPKDVYLACISRVKAKALKKLFNQ